MSKMKKLTALLLALVMVLALAACGGKGDDTTTDTGNDTSTPSTGDSTEDTANPLGYTITEFDPNATYTIRSSMQSFPTQWNPHNYREDSASTLMSYLRDYLYNIAANDELHNPDGKEPWSGYTIIPQMAADMPTDVTEEVKAAHPEWFPESATKGYAWEIPLREDLYFDTGYHITADTYFQSIKYLLDPRLQNYRAADFYGGNGAVVGAESYFNSGRYSYDSMISAAMGDDEYVDPSTFTTTDAGTLQLDGKDIVMNVKNNGNWGGGDPWSKYIPEDHQLIAPMHAAADQDGYVKLTPEMLTNLQTIIAMLHGYKTVEEYAAAEGDYAYKEFEEACWYGYDHEALDFDSTVGYYAKDEYTLVMVFTTSFDPDFFLYFNALLSAGGWLVEPDVYEKCLSQDEAGVWSSSYMTSKETSPSFGAYSMTDFQTDKHVAYGKNEKWYGWHDDVNHVYKDPNDGNVYRTDMATNYDIQIVTEDATRLQMFLMGQLSSYALQTPDYEQYGHSEFLRATPGDAAFGLWLTGNLAGLQARENAAGFDKTKYDLETMTVLNFRKAMAVSFDRQRFCDEVDPAQVPAFGMLGNLYIYDPDTGASYRSSEPAMQALCDFYSVDVSKFDSLEDAVASITGFDLDAAKELYQQAFEDALELGYITDTDNDGKCDQTITLSYSLQGSVSDRLTRQINYLNNSVAEATAGTPFEGKIVFDAGTSQADYLEAFRTGAADWFVVGLTGSSFDPYNAMGGFAQIGGPTFITPWYDPSSDMLTLTVKGEEITMSVQDWSFALVGKVVTVNGKDYSFGLADMTNEERLPILGALEGKILNQYNDFPLANEGSKSLLSQQLFGVFDEYVNMFTEFGPTRFQYTDAEWEAYCNEQIAEHGSLQY